MTEDEYWGIIQAKLDENGMSGAYDSMPTPTVEFLLKFIDPITLAEYVQECINSALAAAVETAAAVADQELRQLAAE
jgi:hypothetical protein